MHHSDHQLKSRALIVAQHECGHYIVARALGFDTGFCAVTVNFPIGHRGESEITLPTPLRTISDTLCYLERRVQVLYAGALAEALDINGINPEQAIKNIRMGSDQDHAKARELIHLTRNLRHPDTVADNCQSELDAIDLELWNKAAVAVLAEREHIEGLACRLANEVKSYGMRAELSAAVIRALPAIQERFPDGLSK
jgi:hypothetical protein